MGIVEQVHTRRESPSFKLLVNLTHSNSGMVITDQEGEEGGEEESIRAQCMMVGLRDDRSMIEITVHTRGRIQLPQPRVRSIQRWMAHTWLSALCNLSRVGSESFTSLLEEALKDYLHFIYRP